MYSTYIVASRSHNFYVGITSDLMKRVWQHKEGIYEGYSKIYKCNRVVWYEQGPSVQVAIAREKQLKGWRREKKIWLIERENPAWVDLSEGWGEMMEPYKESQLQAVILSGSTHSTIVSAGVEGPAFLLWQANRRSFDSAQDDSLW